MSLSKSFLSSIDKSYCFVVDKRINNWYQIKNDLNNVGFNNIEMFLSGGDNLPGLPYNRTNVNETPPRYPNSTSYPNWYTTRAYNAWLSRRKVMEECILQRYKTVAFFEDDIFIEDDFQEIMDNVIENLPNLPSWDMLYLGCYNNQQSTPTKYPNIIRLRGGGGWHAIILKGYVINDLLLFNPIGPYDEITGHYLHDIYNAYAIYPCVISQKSGFSWIENTNLNKPSRYLK